MNGDYEAQTETIPRGMYMNKRMMNGIHGNVSGDDIRVQIGTW
jgi:hypothetical protein